MLVRQRLLPRQNAQCLVDVRIPEPKIRLAEVDDHALCVRARHACELERGECGRGIAAVVLARHRERELDRLEALRAHDERHVLEPFLEERCHLGAGAERRMVIEVDVQQHGDVRARLGDRPVRLVTLDDEPARARAGVATQLRNLAADQERGIAAEALEAERDHPARRGLAVRAGNHDRLP